ncbi:NDP-hexose 2,3-dehydratase family protein [Ottowia caeni]|uniref:NDP-hexose 2,3-dehydratase family protein n=1 Tax=Ottowia caeni TaxID=2870339 RepID=UPI001E34DCF0|nr:NDP-hexose 2,3-dehydratase family protein [Ottowia caeni]
MTSDSTELRNLTELTNASRWAARKVPLPWLADRLGDLSSAEHFSLAHIPLKNSSHWVFRNGAVHHRSGRFFSVIGITAESPSGLFVEQPLLDQREIGTLAVYLRQRAGVTEVLAQFKAEPGNVGLFQLAPSYQATASNTDRVHGGVSPSLGGWLQGGGAYVSDTLQSEQGSRFYGKRNRNVGLLLNEPCEVDTRFHAWMPARDLCTLLSDDHLVNTDLRSTLVCTDWALLGGGRPFGGDGFAQLLRASYELADDQSVERLADVMQQLEKPVEWRKMPKIVPLEALRGWAMDEEGPAPQANSMRPFRVRHILVHSESREVQTWDQPIVQSGGEGRVILPMALSGGVPHFLFKEVAEPGFGTRAELTTAILVEPGALEELSLFEHSLLSGARELVACRQSEEGGRFLFDENQYAIVDAGTTIKLPAGYHWLSLAQISFLIKRGCTFTNEARSALSLLLKWL